MFGVIDTSDVVPPAFYLVVVEDKRRRLRRPLGRLAGRLPPGGRRHGRDAVRQYAPPAG